jgi:hypothetical protein
MADDLSHSMLEDRKVWRGVNWLIVSWITPSSSSNHENPIHHTVHVCTTSKQMVLRLAKLSPEEQSTFIQYVVGLQERNKPAAPFLVCIKPVGGDHRHHKNVLATVVWGEIIPGVEAIITLSPVS